jgi:diguanylate cyclase (GGDEF)-like protein
MDTVARIGGDEFVVMLSELDTDGEVSEVQARGVAEKIRSRLAEAFVLAQSDSEGNPKVLEHRCTASVGCVLVDPNTTDMESKMGQADAAMYKAKALGRNQVVFTP